MTDTFEIKVTDIVEHEDGSATMHLEMDSEAKSLLIEAGIVNLLEQYLENTDD
jgi:hypothetical protein|tara:strand:+ start:912 stop:1070 length:159 start_codon:yes stop_codon:yes gene_type:complete